MDNKNRNAVFAFGDEWDAGIGRDFARAKAVR